MPSELRQKEKLKRKRKELNILPRSWKKIEILVAKKIDIIVIMINNIYSRIKRISKRDLTYLKKEFLLIKIRNIKFKSDILNHCGPIES